MQFQNRINANVRSSVMSILFTLEILPTGPDFKGNENR